ncbi:hypothetical protein CR513_19674, partial [Mucuna pruriens]
MFQLQELDELRLEAYKNSRIYKQKVKQFLDHLSRVHADSDSAQPISTFGKKGGELEHLQYLGDAPHAGEPTPHLFSLPYGIEGEARQSMSNVRTPVLNPYQPREFLWQSPKETEYKHSGLNSGGSIVHDDRHDSPECVGNPNQSPLANFDFLVSDLHFLDREKHQSSIVHHRNGEKQEQRNGYNESLTWITSLSCSLLDYSYLGCCWAVKLGLIRFGRDGVGLGRDDFFSAESSYCGPENNSADPARKEELAKILELAQICIFSIFRPII